MFAVCTRRDTSNPRPVLISIQATSLGRLRCLTWVELWQMRTDRMQPQGMREKGASHPYTGVTEKCPKTLLKEQFKIFLAQTQKIPLCIDLKWLFGGSVFCDGMVTWSPKKVSLGKSSFAVGPGERLQLWDPAHFFLGSLLTWNTSPPSSGSWRIPAWSYAFLYLPRTFFHFFIQVSILIFPHGHSC